VANIPDGCTKHLYRLQLRIVKILMLTQLAQVDHGIIPQLKYCFWELGLQAIKDVYSDKI